MADLTALHKKLQKERKQLLEKLEQLRVQGQPSPQRREGSPFGKREEEAEGAFELEKRLALEKSLINTIAEIDHALQKYEAGTYGLCDSCEQPIEPARLEALPQANLCLSCKSRQAKEAKGGR